MTLVCDAYSANGELVERFTPVSLFLDMTDGPSSYGLFMPAGGRLEIYRSAEIQPGEFCGE